MDLAPGRQSRRPCRSPAFVDHNPRGFGMLQRNRNFDAYGDDDAHWELRPSLWIEPIGDWGDGEVHAARNPHGLRDQRQHHRAMAAEGGPRGRRLGLVRLSAVLVLDAAGAAGSRGRDAARASGKAGKRRRFAVEFVVRRSSPIRRSAAAGERRRSKPRRDKSSSIRLYPYRERRSIRVVFDLDPGSESYSELRLVLKAADKPVSETWLYRWTA